MYHEIIGRNKAFPLALELTVRYYLTAFCFVVSWTGKILSLDCCCCLEQNVIR